jgi:hypothetical protein
MDKIIILIPVYNEEKTVGTVIKNLSKYNVFIVNDGSTDNTKNILKKYKKFKNIEILNLSKNYGYEEALLKGFRNLLKKKFKYILTCDGDNQHYTDNIEKMLLYSSQNKVDLLIGNRDSLNRFVEKILSFAFSFKFGIKDPISGFKLYNSESLREILFNIKNDNTFLISIVYEFLKKTKKIDNFKIQTRKRSDSKVGNTLTVNLKILKQLKYCLF